MKASVIQRAVLGGEPPRIRSNIFRSLQIRHRTRANALEHRQHQHQYMVARGRFHGLDAHFPAGRPALERRPAMTKHPGPVENLQQTATEVTSAMICCTARTMIAGSGDAKHRRSTT